MALDPSINSIVLKGHQDRVTAVAISSDNHDDAHFSDNCVWQLGSKRPAGGREPGIANDFISALRQIGLIGDSVWTTICAVFGYRELARYSGVPVTGGGTWYNWLKSVSPHTPANMGLIPKEIRNQATACVQLRWKAAIANLTDSKFIGMTLTIESQKDRLIARTAWFQPLWLHPKRPRKPPPNPHGESNRPPPPTATSTPSCAHTQPA